MRLIGHLENEPQARTFGDFLYVQGVENQVEPDEGHGWAVWIHAEEELERANRLLPDMPETLYALGKADSLVGNPAAAEKAWKHLIEIEKTGTLAAQAHFGLAGLYRKQGKAEDAAREMQLFQDAKGPQKPQ